MNLAIVPIAGALLAVYLFTQHIRINPKCETRQGEIRRRLRAIK